MLELKRTFNFSEDALIEPIHCKNSWRLLEGDNKTMPKFLPNLTIPGEHRTKRKQNQNRKPIKEKKKKLSFTLCYHTFENPFLFLITLPLSLSSPQLQTWHNNIQNFLWHHIKVNIFPWNKICRKRFHPNLSQFLSYQLPKIYLHFQDKKIFNETSDLNPSQLSCFFYTLSSI